MNLVTIASGTDGLVHYRLHPPGRPDVSAVEGSADTLTHALDVIGAVLAELPPLGESRIYGPEGVAGQ